VSYTVGWEAQLDGITTLRAPLGALSAGLWLTRLSKIWIVPRCLTSHGASVEPAGVAIAWWAPLDEGRAWLVREIISDCLVSNLDHSAHGLVQCSRT